MVAYSSPPTAESMAASLASKVSHSCFTEPYDMKASPSMRVGITLESPTGRLRRQ